MTLTPFFLVTAIFAAIMLAPIWPYSRRFNYRPFTLATAVAVVLVVLVFANFI